MVKLRLLPGTLFSCRARFNFGGRARRARSEKILISGLIIRYLRSKLIKGCFIEWIHLRLLNFNLWLDLIKNSFFKVLTYFIRSSKKFYMVKKKKNQLNRTIFTGFTAIFNKQKLCELTFEQNLEWS